MSAPGHGRPPRWSRSALAALLVLACVSRPNERPPDEDGTVDPIPTPPGVPVGAPTTSATLSPSGGTLATPDGALVVTVPPDALPAETEVSITPISATARGAVAGAFRLRPDGLAFSRPITLTFEAPRSYPGNASIAGVGVVYQDRSGFWHRVEPAARDAAANTISVTTDHFSDWTLTWQTGIPAADGPIRIVQTVGIPFTAQGQATVFLQGDTPTDTVYLLTGTLTVPDSIAAGDEVCVPDQVTKTLAFNAAEIHKGTPNVFRWGVGANWILTCTAPGGAVTTRLMPALFDTMYINLTHCAGYYHPGQIAQPDLLQGVYTKDCGVEGGVQGDWDLRGYYVEVSPTAGLTTTEAGGTATFEMVLNKAPTANVTVGVAADSPEGTVTPDVVTFTPDDWSTPHVVTVAGLDDWIMDGPVVYHVITAPSSSADVRFNGINPADVEVTNADDDHAGLALAPSSGLVTGEAGRTATFQLSLTSQPVAPVTVSLASSNAAEGVVSPASVVLDASSWRGPVTVTVTGVDDAVVDGAAAYEIQAVTSSADPGYAGLAGAVACTNLDDEAALLVSPTEGLVTSEQGAAATFTVRLNSEPSAPVLLPLASTDATEGAPTVAELVFTAADWSVPQTVTVAGADDFVVDGTVAYAVRIGPPSTADARYAALAATVVGVENTDDDAAGITVTPPSGFATSEPGTSVTFTVALTSEPTAPVSLSLSTDDPTEGAVSPAVLTLTGADWNVPHVVTVSAVDDFVMDGTRPYRVILGASTSADPSYQGIDPGDLDFTNGDDDVAGVAVGPPSGPSTSEGGSAVTFDVALTSEPVAPVSIPLSSGDPTEGAVSPALLTFTAADWNVPRPVTVAGVNDFVVDGNQPFAVAIGPVASGDPSYAVIDPADLAFTNLDDDVAGLVATPASGLVTTEAGGVATFEVTLSSEPLADVTVTASSGDATEGTVSPASVTFTALDWNVARTMTVTGQDDDVADGAVAYSVQLAASSGDPLYQGLARAVSVTNVDDDVAGIAVGAPSGVTTSEAGTSVTFTIVLTSEPIFDVSVPVASGDPGEGAVSPAVLSFTAADWNLPQTVTVTGVNDARDDGDRTFQAWIGPSASLDPGYDAIDPADLTFTNVDDDVAGVLALPSSGLETTEAGGTATFQLSLSSEPFADVVVALSSGDVTEGTVSPASVTFTAADWSVARTITVTGVSDAIDDGPVTYSIAYAATSADTGYAAIGGAVSATNLDDDAAGVTVVPPGVFTTSEALTSATFTVVLTSEPLADVTVPVSSSDPTEGTVSPASLTFTPATWYLPQAVTVTGVNDFVVDGSQPYAVVIGSSTSGDPSYHGIDPADLAFTNVDDDVAGVTVGTASGTTTSESGTSLTFTLVLTSQPTAGVAVPVSSLDATEGVASPGVLTFTAADWDVPQTVTVTGVNDLVADGDQPFVVRVATPASDDPSYQGLPSADLVLTNLDDDAAGIGVNPSGGLTTTEGGGAATFQVTLTSQPLSDVTVTLASSDATEGTVSPASMTFTALDWNVAQTATVTGVNDPLIDGGVAYTVQLSAASADGGYQGRTASVGVTNADDDAAGIGVNPSGGLTTTEGGGTATFQVTLSAQPASAVTVTLSSSDGTEGSVSPLTMTFGAGDWNVPQIATVTGANDAVADGAVAYTIQLTAASADPNFEGRTASVGMTNADDDAAGITANPSGGLTTTEGGGTATFQVTLSSQPLADVTVALASSDATEGSVSPASMTFTALDWNVPQTVTVTGANDPLIDGAVAYTIQLGAASTDPNFEGRAASVSVTNTDDDVAGIAVNPSGGLTTTEGGGTATFQVTLSAQPASDVTVTLASTDATEGSVSPASMTFTALDWSVPQTATVTGANDAMADGAVGYTIELAAASADPSFEGRTASVGATNTDDDVAGIDVGVPSGLFTSEAGLAVTFTVRLTSEPTGAVSVPVTGGDPTEAGVSPASLTFTASDWNVPQTVTVTGVNDDLDDGDQLFAVTIGPATSGDASYQGMDPADLTFTNTDDDAAGITANPAGGLTTTEVGGTATFQVTLSSQPLSDVTVNLASSDATEGSVSPASMTFTALDWNVPQTATVTGVNDAVSDGAVGYTIQLGATSADANFEGRSASVTVTNADDDVAGIDVGAPSGLFTSEAGLAVTFTLVLTSEPAADVTIPLSSTDTTEGTVSPASVTFTALDWSTPRTVTVTGADDAIVDGDQLYGVEIGPATSTDPSYAGIDPVDPAFTNVDNDV